MSQPKITDYIGHISPSAITTYLYLQSIAVNGEVTISGRKLAEAIHRTTPAVWEYLDELEKNNIIERINQKTQDGGPSSNRYRLLV